MSDPFQILAAEYRPMIVAYLRSMVRDEHLAEDLTQDTLLTAQESLSKFKEGSNFGKWLRGIARNKALMHWRTAKRKPLVVDSRVVAGIDEVFEQFDGAHEGGSWTERCRKAMPKCVSALSKHLKSAIEQVYFHSKSLDEAATVLGSSSAAVGQRLTRARNNIRTCVTEKLKSDQGYD